MEEFELASNCVTASITFRILNCAIILSWSMIVIYILYIFSVRLLLKNLSNFFLHVLGPKTVFQIGRPVPRDTEKQIKNVIIWW